MQKNIGCLEQVINFKGVNMINPSFKQLDDVSESRYEVCIMVSKRARKIVSGSKPLTKKIQVKPVTQALSEVIEKKVLKK